jgi:hydroxyacylglutathione hydrolase
MPRGGRGRQGCGSFQGVLSAVRVGEYGWGVQVHLVPCLKDNYAYLVHREGSNEALVVDASDGPPVVAELTRLGLKPVAILATHHHLDHVGGNEALLARFPELRVFGHRSDSGRIPGQTDLLDDGQQFDVAGIGVKALHIPGHTLGAVAYVAEGAAFTGDTLFAAGCGRLFEGTAAQMYESLNLKLGALPDDTRIYCGHEYTVGNLRFAETLEPNNPEIAKKLAWARAARERGQPTLPSTLGEERLTNPFLRVAERDLIAQLKERAPQDGSPQAVLAVVRAMKDAF